MKESCNEKCRPQSQLAEFTTGRKLAEKLKFQRMNFFQVQTLGIDLNKLILLQRKLIEIRLFYFTLP